MATTKLSTTIAGIVAGATGATGPTGATGATGASGATTTISNGTSNLNIASSGGAITANTAGSERARFDTSGNLLVGVTSVPGSLGNSFAYVTQGISAVNSGGTTPFFQVYNSNASTDLKTWRMGNTDNTGSLSFQTINDAYSSATERMRIDSIGQIYHNTSYLLGSSYNCYHAKMTTAVSVSTSWQDTGVAWTNVYIPGNTRKILLWYNASLRNNGLNGCHTAFRVRVVNNSTSATTYVGNGSWGFGINMPIDSAKNHFQINQHINLLDYTDQGNQASFSGGSTYTIYLQVTDASASGGNLKLGGDMTFQSYTPVQGTIWVI